MSYKTIIIMFGIIILNIITVTAFANTFLEDDTMLLSKGEVGKYCIFLQNTGGKEVTQSIDIFNGSEYIINLPEILVNFNVKPNTVSDDYPVCLNVSLPVDHKPYRYYVNRYECLNFTIINNITKCIVEINQTNVSYNPNNLTMCKNCTTWYEQNKLLIFYGVTGAKINNTKMGMASVTTRIGEKFYLAEDVKPEKLPVFHQNKKIQNERYIWIIFWIVLVIIIVALLYYTIKGD